MERAARGFVEIQAAVKRNPKHPDFVGLGHGTSGALDESGAVRTGQYHQWLAEQQKIDGMKFKYAREHRDELAAERKRMHGAPAPGGGGGAAGGGRGKAAWKKNKSGAGADAPAPP